MRDRIANTTLKQSTPPHNQMVQALNYDIAGPWTCGRSKKLKKIICANAKQVCVIWLCQKHCNHLASLQLPFSDLDESQE